MSSNAIEKHLRASVDAQRAGDFDGMLDAARRACKSAPVDLQARFRLLECLLYCGRVDEILANLAELEQQAHETPSLLAQIAEFYTHCADHHSALRVYRAALALQPDSAAFHFAVSSALVATGDLDTASEHLEKTIALDPHDYDAYRNRATLRKQSLDNNHIDEIERLLANGVRSTAGKAQLCYALAKEHEDLGNYDESFAWLKRGANARRSNLRYDVNEDIAVMERLIQVFDEPFVQGKEETCDDEGSIFVMGLPRSGTTLVDRVLSSHSHITSLGEINNFAYSMMHSVGRASNKLAMIDASSKTDFAQLGQRYRASTQRYDVDAPNLIDKTPLNYLYVALIRKSLPKARIIFVQRGPMDSLYGMYRSLFRAGYPFTYDFDDLGRYYLAYRKLVDHWQSLFGDAIHWLNYESLVDDFEPQCRRVIEFCGLDWESQCVEFHRNTSAVATASSAQVRRPVYRDAIGRWRHYERQLAPLCELLNQHNIDVDHA